MSDKVKFQLTRPQVIMEITMYSKIAVKPNIQRSYLNPYTCLDLGKQVPSADRRCAPSLLVWSMAQPLNLSINLNYCSHLDVPANFSSTAATCNSSVPRQSKVYWVYTAYQIVRRVQFDIASVLRRWPFIDLSPYGFIYDLIYFPK